MAESGASARIIEQIQRNRISTTEIADCLSKTGALDNVTPVNARHFAVGPVWYTYAHANSNWPLHRDIEEVPAGSVVLVDLIDCEQRSPLGGLIAKYLLLYKQASAIVVLGPVRDAAMLIRENWPIWSVGVNPIGCFNEQPASPLESSILEQRRRRFEGSLAVCDDCGVVVIPEEKANDAFVEKLNWIEEQEDIWFDCIDRRKLSTFQTVCKKVYLNDSSQSPDSGV